MIESLCLLLQESPDHMVMYHVKMGYTSREYYCNDLQHVPSSIMSTLGSPSRARVVCCVIVSYLSSIAVQFIKQS